MGTYADGPLSRQIHLFQNDLFALSYFFPNPPSHASAERAMSGLWPFLIPQNMSCFMRLNPAKAPRPIFALWYIYIYFFLPTFLSVCHPSNDGFCLVFFVLFFSASCKSEAVKESELVPNINDFNGFDCKGNGWGFCSLSTRTEVLSFLIPTLQVLDEARVSIWH